MTSKNKRKPILFLFVWAILLLSLLSIPLLVSNTKAGKHAVVSLIQKETGYSIYIEKLKLSWLGQQKAHGVEIFEKDKFRLFSAQMISVRGSLLRLLLCKKPKSISIMSWELQWRTPKQETLESRPRSFNPYLNLLSRIKHADLLSEQGTINIYERGHNIDASLSHLYLKKTKEQLIVSGVTKSQQTSGSLSIKGTLRKPFHLDADIKSLPTLLLYPLFNSYLSTDLLKQEEFVNLSLQTLPQDKQITVKFKSRTKNTDLAIQGYIHNKVFHISEKSHAIFQCNPPLAILIFEQFFPLSSKVSMLPILISLSSAQIPLNAPQWKKSELVARVSLPKIAFTAPNTSAFIQVNDLNINLDKDSRQANIQSSASLNLGNKNKSYINSSVNIDTKKNATKFQWQQSQLPHTALAELFPSMAFLQIPLDVPYYSFSVEGNYKRSQVSANILLDNPALQISCQAKGPLHALKFHGKTSYAFTDKWQKKMAPFCTNIQGDFSGKLNFSNQHIYFPKFYGKLSCGENEIFFHGKSGKAKKAMTYDNSSLLIYGKLGLLPLSLINSNLSDLFLNKANFSFHSDGNKALLKGNTQVLISNLTDKDASDTRLLIPDILVSALDPEKALSLNNISIQTSGEILDFPTDYLLKIQGKEARLSNFIGPLGSATFALNYHPLEEDPLILNITANTDATQGQLLLAMDKEFKLTDKTKGSLHWEVTPERYLSLFENTSYTPSCLLYRKTDLRLNLSKLICNENTTGFPCLASLLESGVEGSLSSSPLIFYDHATRESFIINELSGEFYSKNLERQLDYKLKGSCISQKSTRPLSTFAIKGSLSNALTKSQRVWEQQAEWAEIPINFVGGVFPFSVDVKTKLLSLAGPQINVNIANHFTNGQGPLTIRIHSSNLQANLPLILTHNAILLENNLTAELKINEEINQAFFREINPLISSNAYSEHPIFLQVNKENFYLPIWPYSFQNFKVQSASLDFGKIFIKNSNTLYDIFQFLDIEEDKPSVEAWFTPIFFSINHGVLEYKRFDALLDRRVRLALWGKTDLIKQRINTNLGIDPEVIKKHFRNTSLKTKNFFVIKIRGPISSPEVDWSSAYARIALLKSYSLVSPFSSFADHLFSSLGDTTPPQTTSPLPWEQEIKKTQRRKRR